MAYLLTLLVLIGCMVLLDARYRLFVFHRPVPALLSLVLGTGIFVLWDVLAIAEGIFLHLESPWMTGIMVADQLPLEEIFFLFFLCYQTMILVNGWQLFRARTRPIQARESR
ncbi:lycopene cyclase domain-containing protein [Glutamicibacter sp. MNS18]|uniref:lycopene cyclase domain-containing protein n=1 Tax=Glutamicibacter sp. MNS18 TaxID=2989817 RepID=UPI00278C24BA|nr:lycopene cyclase domain-containing protein [Glutamicibacter sp. MNS18]